MSIEDNENLKHAVQLVDQGEIDSSLYILEALVKKHPKNYIINYEYTYSLVKKGNFAEANKILRKLESYPEADDRLHAMIGNTYDYMGHPDKALKAYQNGLKKFPNSGVLHVEQGNVYASQRDYDKAIPYYEKGIEVDPLYPTSYLRASTVYLSSSEPVWGLIYTEMFSLLRPGSNESKALCKLSLKVLRNNLKMEGDTLHATLTNKNNIIVPFKHKKEDVLNAIIAAGASFEVGYERQVLLAAMANKYKDTLDFDLFCKIRESIANNIINTEDSLPLFNFHKKIIDAGFWKAYNILIYGQAFPTEFEAYMANEENVNQLKTFMTWYNTAANFPNKEEPVSKNIFERNRMK